MASPTVDLGSGFALTISGFTMEILSARWTGVERAAVDTTHIGVGAATGINFGNRTFAAGVMVDPGQIEVTAHFNPDDSPPIGDAVTTVTAAWPSTGASTVADWEAQGFMTSFDIDGIGIDEKMVLNATIKLTDTVTVTSAT